MGLTFYNMCHGMIIHLQTCDYTACIDTRETILETMISCGTVVSDDAVNGVKCAHVTKTKAGYSTVQDWIINYSVIFVMS